MSDVTEVRQALRAAILRGDYAPRQRLIEIELVEEYAASRFIIRNALLQLAGDGLIEMQPNRGARIREISVAEAIEITEIRQCVEGLVAGRAAEKISNAEISELSALANAMSSAVSDLELMRYSDLNATLHARLRAIAQHPTADRILEQLNGQMVHHQFTLSLLPGRPNTSLPEHLAIITAVCARDPARAELAMREHIGSVIRALSEFEKSDRKSLRHDRPSRAHQG